MFVCDIAASTRRPFAADPCPGSLNSPECLLLSTGVALSRVFPDPPMQSGPRMPSPPRTLPLCCPHAHGPLGSSPPTWGFGLIGSISFGLGFPNPSVSSSYEDRARYRGSVGKSRSMVRLENTSGFLKLQNPLGFFSLGS